MRFVELNSDDRALVERTRTLLRKGRSDISSVAAGLRTAQGREYFGLDIELDVAPVSMCAEYSAIGAMVSDGEREVVAMVAVCYREKDRYPVLRPCGKCRELARAFGNPYVILQAGKRIDQLKKVKLSWLIPFDEQKR